MRELLVPTDAIEVEIHTDRRERFHGTLFAAPLVERSAVDELAMLLNDDRSYLPLRLAAWDGTRRETLIRKRHMTCVRLAGDAAVEPSGADGDGNHAALHPTGPSCQIFLADGESLSGTLDVAVPESHARVIDRLNRAARFLPVTTVAGLTFINRAQVVQVL